MPTLADRIRRRIDHLKLSKPTVAKGAGVSRQAVYDWLRGDTKELRGPTLLKLARTLGTSPEWLATGRGEPDGSAATGGGVSEEAMEIANAWDALPDSRRRLYRDAILQDSARAVVFPELEASVATRASYHVMIERFRRNRDELERQLKLGI